MTPEEFERFIRQREGEALEFKRELPARDGLLKTVVAFANTSGGKLLLGVDDTGSVWGLADADPTDYADRIAGMVSDSIQPPLFPDIYAVPVGERTIIVVEVFASPSRPHFLRRLGKESGTYVRLGSTNRQADSETQLELERQRLGLCFDEEPWLFAAQSRGSAGTAAAFTATKTILSARLGREVTNTDLVNLRFASQQPDELVPTNAAWILMGADERTAVRCARFKGDTMRIFLDQKDYLTDLFSLLDSTMGFLLGNIRLRGEIGPDHLTRIDTYEIPPEALREAVVNALVHRDYSRGGSDIKVAVYDSTVDIISPGGLPRGMTVEDAMGGRSETRNRVIARAFREARLIEQWGTGLSRLVRLCTDHGLRSPELSEEGDFVRVRFFRDSVPPVSGRPEMAADQKAREGPEKQQPQPPRDDIGLALALLRAEPRASRRVLAEQLGLSDSAVKRRLEALVAEGRLRRVGPDRGGYWEVTP